MNALNEGFLFFSVYFGKLGIPAKYFSPNEPKGGGNHLGKDRENEKKDRENCGRESLKMKPRHFRDFRNLEKEKKLRRNENEFL